MNKLGLFIFTICISLTVVSAVKGGRVIGGNEVKLGDYPWHVSINYGDIYICAGALVSDRHVLTTRNCLEPYVNFPGLLYAHMGVLVAADPKNRKQGLKIYLAAPISPNNMESLSILELNGEVIIGTDILAISPVLTEKLEHMDTVILSGWGFDDGTIYNELHDVELNIESITSVCALDGSKPLCTYGVDVHNVNERVGPCKWDEGAALVRWEELTNDPVVVGVVKHTNRCSEGLPKESKYVPTEPLVLWIENITNPSPE